MVPVIQFLLKRPLYPVMATAILLGIGCLAAPRLPLDALPDIVSLEMEVNTTVDAFSPEEVEAQVTVPLERALTGIPGLEAMRSTSQFGLSQIELIFHDNVSVIAVRQLVNERLQAVRDSLPPDTQPVLAPLKSGLGEIIYYSLSYDKKAPEYRKPREEQLIALKRYQVYALKPRIESMSGVAAWSSFCTMPMSRG